MNLQFGLLLALAGGPLPGWGAHTAHWCWLSAGSAGCGLGSQLLSMGGSGFFKPGQLRSKNERLQKTRWGTCKSHHITSMSCYGLRQAQSRPGAGAGDPAPPHGGMSGGLLEEHAGGEIPLRPVLGCKTRHPNEDVVGSSEVAPRAPLRGFVLCANPS